ncbi:NAD(P)-dependent oxidoreductase [bacterium]|nr:NAD(P)-dependent oxidoreductase [bacterium]
MAEIMTPKKVFITGANGFIARSLAMKYRELGADVCGIDFVADSEWGVVVGDLLDPESWQETLVGVDLVIHCAALVSNTASMDDAWRVNVLGTKLVLDAAVIAGVKRFVHLSSGGVYGFEYVDQQDEETPLRPINHPYVDTKIAAEHLVLATHLRGEIDCTIVRPADIYGPGSKPWVVLPLEMMKAGKFLLPENGRGIFLPLYIDDLVDGIILAAGDEQGKGQIFNLCSDEMLTCVEFFSYHAGWAGAEKVACIPTSIANPLADLVGGFTRLMGKPSELGRNTMMMLARKHGLKNDKAKRLLGFAPQVKLEEGMRKVEAWLRESQLIE